MCGIIKVQLGFPNKNFTSKEDINMLKNYVTIVIRVPDDNAESGKLSDLINNLTRASISIGFLSILPSEDYDSSDMVHFTITYPVSDSKEVKKIVENTLDKPWQDCTSK